MKTIFIILILLLISVNISLGKVIELGDVSNDTLKNLYIKEGDAILFNLFNYEHAIVIKKIQYKGVDIAIFPFRNATVYTTLKEDTRTYIDLDRDNFDDVSLRLINYKNGTNANAMIRFAILQNTKENNSNPSTQNNKSEITGKVIEDDIKRQNSNLLFIFIPIVIILLISLIFLLRKKTLNTKT